MSNDNIEELRPEQENINPEVIDVLARSKMIAITKITPYHNNPKNNTDAAVEAVAQSIIKFGFNVPLVLDTNNVIVSGHTRYKAALKLKLKKLPCIVKEFTEQQATAYRIADNKAGEIDTWDQAKTIQELRLITDLDGMDIFFPKVDLDDLVKIDMGALDYMETTQADIEAAEEAQGNKFADISDQAQADYLEIPCPHCGETITFSRSQLESKLTES